jgi:hypothetical protein
MDYQLELTRVISVFVKQMQERMNLVDSILPESMTALKFISELNPVSWVWNDNEARSGSLDFGFIAQEVDALQKKYDVDLNLVRYNGEYLWIYPENFLFVLLSAIQELLQINTMTESGDPIA